MSNCVVHLDNFQGKYYGGNTIAGQLICSFNSPKSIRAIKIRLQGHEHTHWTKRESYYDSSSKKTKYRTVHYSGNNTIFCMEQTVSGEGDYPAGRHEYHFTFALPTQLPVTFRNQYGGIKYSVKAVVDRPYRFDYENEVEFDLVSPVDFNLIPGLQMTIVSRATSPKHDSKHDYELVASDSDTGVGAHGERTYNFNLQIPESTAVYNFTKSELFSQYGTLEVTAELPSCHVDLDISTTVTLGHIPLRGHEPVLQTSYPVPPYSSTQNGLSQGMPYPPNAPPCPSGDSSPPPYPTGPSKVPDLSGSGHVGFTVPLKPDISSSPSNALPSELTSNTPLLPFASSSSYSPNAPPPDSAPSAPSKAEIAKDEDFVMIDDDGNDDPVPPSYNDAMKNSMTPQPPK